MEQLEVRLGSNSSGFSTGLAPGRTEASQFAANLTGSLTRRFLSAESPPGPPWFNRQRRKAGGLGISLKNLSQLSRRDIFLKIAAKLKEVAAQGRVADKVLSDLKEIALRPAQVTEMLPLFARAIGAVDRVGIINNQQMELLKRTMKPPKRGAKSGAMPWLTWLRDGQTR